MAVSRGWLLGAPGSSLLKGRLVAWADACEFMRLDWAPPSGVCMEHSVLLARQVRPGKKTHLNTI